MFLKTDEVKIFNDDCRNVFPQLKDIALVVTSPPYNQLGKRFPKNTSNHKISIHNFAAKARSAYFDDRDEKTYAEFITDCFVQCRECCNWDASLVVNHKCRWRKRQLLHPIDLIRTFEPSWYLRQEVIWARKGSTAFQAKMFAPSDERLYWCTANNYYPPKGQRTNNPTFCWNQEAAKFLSVWDVSQYERDSRNNHPCPMPEEIAKRLIIGLSKPGDVVLDPFMGSGVTLKVARDLGRKAIGIDTEKEYCELAKEILGL
tara:strand:- start:13310 stop:14086 length:777 start_codon:yes stop_codon:yes gene_type:complete